jgi:hypothetical protein
LQRNDRVNLPSTEDVAQMTGFIQHPSALADRQGPDAVGDKALTVVQSVVTADKTISVVDTKSGAVMELPGSKGLFSPRWSPNGQYLAAITLDQRKLRICNLSNKQWTEVLTASIDNPVWSSDSRSIYYHSFMEPDLPIYKLDVQTHKQEKIFQLKDLQIPDAADYSFKGVSPEGSPIVAVHLWSADVYQIVWKHP